MAHATTAPGPLAPAAPTRSRRKPVARDCSAAFMVAPAGSASGADLPEHERAVVNAALGILARYMRTSNGPLFGDIQAVRDYLRLSLCTKPHEVFAVLFLDSQHRLLAFEEMFRGTLTQTSVYPREVVVRALHHQAAAVILAHNHPSGNAKPSGADIALTQTLNNTLALVDVKVLDHFVVAGFNVTSMAELGLV